MVTLFQCQVCLQWTCLFFVFSVQYLHIKKKWLAVVFRMGGSVLAHVSETTWNMKWNNHKNKIHKRMLWWITEMSCLYIIVLGYQVHEGFFFCFLFFCFCCCCCFLFICFLIRKLIRKRESILRHTVGVSKRNSNEKSHVYRYVFCDRLVNFQR